MFILLTSLLVMKMCFITLRIDKLTRFPQENSAEKIRIIYGTTISVLRSIFPKLIKQENPCILTYELKQGFSAHIPNGKYMHSDHQAKTKF